MHDYDFFAFLDGLKAAEERARQKSLKTSDGPTSLCSPDRRGSILPVRAGDRDPAGPAEPVVDEGTTAFDLQALLGFLGED
jgi:hypothetical protein